MRLMYAAAIALLLCVFVFSATTAISNTSIVTDRPPINTNTSLSTTTSSTTGTIPPIISDNNFQHTDLNAGGAISSPISDSAGSGTSSGASATSAGNTAPSSGTAASSFGDTATSSASGSASATTIVGPAGTAINVSSVVVVPSSSSGGASLPSAQVTEAVAVWAEVKYAEKAALVSSVQAIEAAVVRQTITVEPIAVKAEAQTAVVQQVQPVLSVEALTAAVRNMETNEVGMEKSVVFENVKDAATGEDRNMHRFVLGAKNNTAEILYDVSIVEAVPKEIALSGSEIVSGYGFKVLQDDPVIEFVIPVLEPGESFSVDYSVSGDLSESDLNKSSGPVAFFLKEGDAQAAFTFVLGEDANEDSSLQQGAEDAQVQGEVVGQDNTTLYAAGAVAVILIVVLVFVVFKKLRKRPAQTEQQPAQPQDSSAQAPSSLQAPSSPAQEPIAPPQPPQPFAPASDDGIVYPPGQNPPGLGMPPAA